jgi:hypothetical protein
VASWRWGRWALLAAGLVCLAGRGSFPDVPIETFALLLVGPIVLDLAHRATARTPGWAGLGLGAALVGAAWFHDGSANRVTLVVSAAGALLALGSYLPRAPLRGIATCAAIAIVAGFLALRIASSLTLQRVDQPVESSVPESPGPNLLLVVMNTVRADRLASYGYERVTTPNLDAFIESRARLYFNARSTSSWTLPSHASLLTGRLPGEHGATHAGESTHEPEKRGARWPAHPLRSDTPTLAENLAARGYETAAILSNYAYLAHHFGLDRGFHRYDDRRGALIRERFALVQHLGLYAGTLGAQGYRDARAITDEALRWLRSRDPARPFFLFVNYMDAHSPLIPQPPFDTAFDDARPANPIKPEREIQPLQYDRCLLQLDHQLGRLLDALDASGWMDRTLVVITSDHGESFGEHGVWHHGMALYDSLIRVPLVVKQAAGAEDVPIPAADASLSGADVFHLIAAQLRLHVETSEEVPPLTAEWYRSDELDEYMPMDIDRDLLAWMEGDLKFIVSSAGAVEIYDIAADPDELSPLEPEPEQVGRALEKAERWWSRRPAAVPQEHPLAPDVVEGLRALGYLP